jgi:hypothetical protein
MPVIGKRHSAGLARRLRRLLALFGVFQPDLPAF